MASTADSSPHLGTLSKHPPTGEEWLATLDASLARGIAAADAGRVMPSDEVKARLITKYKAMAASSARPE